MGRLHYVYPYPHVDELIPLMAEGKILPYLDVPLQHASPRLLKAMKRPANSGDTLERIRRWREICPGTDPAQHLYRRFSGRDRGRFRAIAGVFGRSATGSGGLL